MSERCKECGQPSVTFTMHGKVYHRGWCKAHWSAYQYESNKRRREELRKAGQTGQRVPVERAEPLLKYEPLKTQTALLEAKKLIARRELRARMGMR